MASLKNLTITVAGCYVRDKPAVAKVGAVPFCGRCAPDSNPYDLPVPAPKPTPAMIVRAYCSRHGYEVGQCDRWCGV